MKSSSSDVEYFSIFMLFCFAKGTDNTIDISSCFTDIENYEGSNNWITKLSEVLTIDNNIFGYISANKIKLISIPNEIFLYNGEETTALTNENILEFENRLEQNKIYIKDYNKNLINELLNEKDNEKRTIFEKIFNLTFVQVLKHFRKEIFIEELKGLTRIDEVCEKFDNSKGDKEEYKNYFKKILEIELQININKRL